MLPAGETLAGIEVSHPDTGYTLYVQGDTTATSERAVYRLLGQIISSPFYEELRTNRQLGYIVYATSYEMLETPALGFVVQSPNASATEINEAVAAFASDFADTLANMSESDLKREKQAIISKLLEKDRRLGEISERYWQEIDRGDTNFDSRQAMANAIRRVSKEQLMNVLQSKLIDRDQALRTFTQSEPSSEQALLDSLYERPFVPKAMAETR